MPDYVDVVTVCVDDVGGSKVHEVRADSPRGGERWTDRLSPGEEAVKRIDGSVSLHQPRVPSHRRGTFAVYGLRHMSQPWVS